MLSVVTVNYLVYCEEEIEEWKKDSLEFYLSMRDQSNETKGNYLREKAEEFLAAVMLRFTTDFQAFC